MPLLGGSPRRVGNLRSNSGAAWSPDGQRIVYQSGNELHIARNDGTELAKLATLPKHPYLPRWSPDGKLIAFEDLSNGDRSQMARSSPRRVYVVSADGGGPVLLLAGQYGDPTWSPDGKSIAYDYNAFSADQATEVRILDLQTLKSTKVPGSEGMWSPRWSPDGKYLAALRHTRALSKLVLFAFATNTWEELDPAGHGWPCWSTDSKFIYAYSSASDSLVRVAISDHKEERIASLQGFRGTAYYFDRWNFTWSGVTPDGRPIALRDTGIQELYAFDLEYK
jgi:dipeptidyl aminopeptidase/acylaminoacyl peptidase